MTAETTADGDETPLTLTQRGRLTLGRDTPRYKRLLEDLSDEYERLRQKYHHD
jgi:hypothetical protein